ncbi:MAG: protein-export chaperone SecB [Bacteroidales bacterium]|nr:protein-export chaperone SecB [Bacteroidales bacterium]
MINFENLPINPDIDITFSASGKFNSVSNVFEVRFGFSSRLTIDKEREIISVDSIARFTFSTPMQLENIPDYFYSNSIAILFPYMRAFISTISLQANVSPLILPTLNMTKLGETLKENSFQE